MKILIVEDSDMIRNGIIQLLNQINEITILETGSGQAALTIFEEEKPDVIVLDLGLPYVSGFEVLRRIKNINPAAFVIILTNHSDKYFSNICMKYGADYFFDKSNQLEEFAKSISDLKIKYTAKL